jgi:UDP-N-acetylmuramate dehydrogenase
MNWPESLNKKIRNKVNLAKLTTLRTGGAARYFAEVDSFAQLRDALVYAKSRGMRLFILGAGSNVLVSERGLDGLVVKLAGGCFKKISAQGNCLEAGAGAPLARLVSCAGDNCLCGLEFLSGIPGTVGGALAGNAGAWGRSICEKVKEAVVLDGRGNMRVLSPGDFKFSYRSSELGKYAIVSCKFKLRKGEKAGIRARVDKYIRERKKTQKDILPSAGCIFKNPPDDSAGRLIDLCGLKGASRGGAAVSLNHANFILNKGNASSRDILSLMNFVNKKVNDKFKVKLEREIKIWR